VQSDLPPIALLHALGDSPQLGVKTHAHGGMRHLGFGLVVAVDTESMEEWDLVKAEEVHV
jgi:hypothetical protein